MEEYNAPTCEQADQLISYLYGELNEVDSETFQRHTKACRSCSTELEAFGSIRRSVVAWRDEALGGMSTVPTTAPAVAARVNRQNPSAIAALREFFNLAPVWLKGAVAFATVLFCLFAGLSVAHLRSNPPAPVASIPSSNYAGYSEEELNARVEQRVQYELKRATVLASQSTTPAVVASYPANKTSNRRHGKPIQVATNSPQRRPLSRVEREQLAADLRLVAVNNDSDLDLLEDRINQ